MTNETLYRYGRGRSKFYALAATTIVLLVSAWMLTYSVSRFGLPESITAALTLLVIDSIPLVTLRAVLDVGISGKSIDRCFGRFSWKRVAWDSVVDATEIDFFHSGYGRIVRTYHFRTRPDAVIPAVSFLDTIDDVESLLLLVNRTLASRGIPMFHKVGERRNSVASLTVGPQ
ncbi:hypothetical protein J2X57_003737 [Luteibacter sp. 1214]|uniref:hypothetical protein n=1 Tax=Luteibacter sp. 1214 TaxID=2817735 RepID=UPI0028665986|nr:hypothetical protein [Luteibacter sp. 1214]MDR6644494.1 hypothetical protein [Luteibacter sp. 1214]